MRNLAQNPILSKIPFYLEKPSKVWGKSHFHFFLRFCRFSCQNWGKSKFWNLNFEIIISFDKKIQPQCFNENTTAWSSGCVTSTHNISVKVVNPDFRHVDFSFSNNNYWAANQHIWKISNSSSTISRRNWDDPKVPRGPRRRVGALCQIWQESEISNLRFQWRFRFQWRYLEIFKHL